MTKIDTSDWKEFKLSDMFNIDMGNKFDKNKVIRTDGDYINFIGRTGSNNGINATCGIYHNTKPFPAGLLTLSLGGTVGACFVQQQQFYTSQNVCVLIPIHNMNMNQKLFIASCIFKESQLNYSAFIKELNKHVKHDFTFKLPVDAND